LRSGFVEAEAASLRRPPRAARLALSASIRSMTWVFGASGFDSEISWPSIFRLINASTRSLTSSL
jgi:hypothetical protein